MKPVTAAERKKLHDLLAQGKAQEAWEILVAPLHQQLVAAQSFDVLDELPAGPRLMLILDYLEGQIGQGGFIQLFQNGYAPLLLEATELLQAMGLVSRLAESFDEALKLFSIYITDLGRETTVAEFSRLYEQFPQFQPLETQFEQWLPELKNELMKKWL